MSLSANPTKIKIGMTFYGQAGFKFDLPNGKVVILDPWIKTPFNPNGEELLNEIDRADVILCTHGHFDHIADATEIAKKTGAKLVAPPELTSAMVKYLDFPAENGIESGVAGDKLTLLDGDLEIEFTKAVHGSSIRDPKTEATIETGEPTGILMRFKDGPVIYHSGDTALFDEMSEIALPREIDLYAVCIGGHFVMDPAQAAEAVRRIQPREVMPMHYGTLPVLSGTAEEFESALDELGIHIPVHVMKAGDHLSYPA